MTDDYAKNAGEVARIAVAKAGHRLAMAVSGGFIDPEDGWQQSCHRWDSYAETSKDYCGGNRWNDVGTVSSLANTGRMSAPNYSEKYGAIARLRVAKAGAVLLANLTHIPK